MTLQRDAIEEKENFVVQNTDFIAAEGAGADLATAAEAKLTADNFWLSVPEVAQLLQVRQRDVRTMISKSELLAVRLTPQSALVIHRAQLCEVSGKVAVLPAMKGTLTALADVGFSDLEKIEWLLAENAELGCAPIVALRAGNIHAVRRAITTAL